MLFYVFWIFNTEIKIPHSPAVKQYYKFGAHFRQIICKKIKKKTLRNAVSNG